jgi:hypothetical protein
MEVEVEERRLEGGEVGDVQDEVVMYVRVSETEMTLSQRMAMARGRFDVRGVCVCVSVSVSMCERV